MNTVFSLLPFEGVEPDPATVTPGPPGFLVMALIGIVTILLILDMVRRLRRMRYREQARETIAAEQAAAAKTGQASEDPQ